MRTQEAEKTDILRMDVSGQLLFCPFPKPERKPHSICVFLSPSDEFRCGHAQTSRAVQGCQSIGLAEQHRSRVPVNKSAFSLPKEYMCMFKAHSLSLERVVFSFWGADMMTMSTLSGFSSSLVHKNWSV